MPRRRRMYLRDVPCHVVQRGNNRLPTFFSTGDYRYYLDCLAEACATHAVALHAYVLMTNHVHLLMTPRDRPEGVSRVMQSLGRRYVYHVNGQLGRTGTLWEGRHKASLVAADSYLLACSRYIELNPVRAGMVDRPDDYHWSSHASNAYGRVGPCPIEPHPAYSGLGEDRRACRKAYRELFSGKDFMDHDRAIRSASAASLPFGSGPFREQVERMIGRGLGHARRGRPRLDGG